MNKDIYFDIVREYTKEPKKENTAKLIYELYSSFHREIDYKNSSTLTSCTLFMNKCVDTVDNF